jgi:uncharacterized protein YutE (UPF0331/DUF86 family)
MTAGPLDLKIVGDRLGIVRRCLTELRQLPATDLREFSQDFRNSAAAESLLRRAIEAALDTARHLLSRTHGLAALEYRAVAREAGKKGLVVDPVLQQRFVEIPGFRNRLTHFYDEVTPQELFTIISEELDDLGRISDELASAASRSTSPGS